MTGFGDDDPEDAYDDGDSAGQKVAVLERWVPSIAAEHAEPGHDHVRVVVRIALALATIDAIGHTRYRRTLRHLRHQLAALRQQEGP